MLDAGPVVGQHDILVRAHIRAAVLAGEPFHGDLGFNEHGLSTTSRSLGEATDRRQHLQSPDQRRRRIGRLATRSRGAPGRIAVRRTQDSPSDWNRACSRSWSRELRPQRSASWVVGKSLVRGLSGTRDLWSGRLDLVT
jgi:hypothetical protein